MRSCVFFAIVALTSNVFAAETLRYFVSIDSPAATLTMVEMNMGDKPVALLKLQGVQHNDSGKVFMFAGEENKRFMPLQHATNMVLIDYDKKTLVKGTLKKVWTLAGLDKDITLEETTAPTTVTVQSIKSEYDKSEGQGQSADMSQMVNQKCGTKINVKTDKATFTKTGLAEHKGAAAAQGLADVCTDKDYIEAMKAFKDVTLSSTTAKDITVDRKGSTLVVGLPKDIQNTTRAVKKALEKAL